MSSTLTLWTNVPRAAVRLWSQAIKPEWAPTIEAGHSSEGAYDERYTDPAGNTSFMFVPDGPCTAYLTAPGYQPLEFSTTMPDEGAKALTLVHAPLPRLRVEGQRFVTDVGPVFLKGASMFTLFQRFLDAEDIRPQLALLQAYGANAVRVFGMFHWINFNEFGKTAFNPKNYDPWFYTQTRAFCDLCAEHGLYVYWSCFPDNKLIMPTHAERRAHYDRWVPILEATSNSVFELTNEPGGHDFNAVDVRAYPRPTRLASCAGSHGDTGGLFPAPMWDFFDFHTPREYPKAIKDCCVADAPDFLAGRPIFLGEPDRFGSNGNANADHARMVAGSSRGTALGIVFHSRNGVRGEVFDDVTRRCADAFFSVL